MIVATAATIRGSRWIMTVGRAMHVPGASPTRCAWEATYFTVQNRSDAPFVLEAATLAQDGKELPAARVAFNPPAEGALGKVDGGQRGTGVVVIASGSSAPAAPSTATCATPGAAASWASRGCGRDHPRAAQILRDGKVPAESSALSSGHSSPSSLVKPVAPRLLACQSGWSSRQRLVLENP